ncbi:MAG: RHS repeat-associated core domain-containing protein [Bacteroidales bacterium]|nr:RHS repeat-associated core domain-containing protein [Bacteroidales bacterium]
MKKRISNAKTPLQRGYCGHIHYDHFGLIDMGGRVYDPILGRFLSPDPYVQAPENSQNFNRFSYCLNNPLKYTDPTGEFVWLPFAIGGIIGGIQGYMIGKSSGLSGWGRFATTFFGAGIGAASAGFGSYVSSSAGVMANTLSVVGGSYYNSIGMSILGGFCGQNIPLCISFGAGSLTFGENGIELGYLGKKGNQWYENLGYGLGAMASVSDFLVGSHPQDVDLVTEHSDLTGHVAIVEPGTETAVPHCKDPNALISVGPDRINFPNGSWHRMPGCNTWDSYSRQGEKIWRNTLRVNKKTIVRYSNWLNRQCDGGAFHV